jgi:TonB-linked SusC/RagA family outer membrane protein
LKTTGKCYQHFPEDCKNYAVRFTLQRISNLYQYKNMKKKFCFDREWKLFGLIKLLKVMKLTVFLLLVSVAGVIANKSYSQTKTLNLNLRDATVKEVLKSIEEQSGFHFLYSENLINVERKVNGTIENKKIEQILNLIFEGTNVDYSIRDRFIVLTTPEENDILAQQDKPISGRVIDSSGTSLPGVSVVIKGMTKGTITDASGNYSLADVPANAELVFSFVGMKTQEIPVSGKTTINVTLTEETVGIEEVVAIGYGTMKKSNVTGAISSIKMEETPIVGFSTVSHALAGKAAGLQVTQTSAQVGGAASLLIRGAASTGAGNAPLIIIDGFPISFSISLGSGNRYDSGNTDNILESINPNDIESIEVLKDASSTAIYGARAGHGVIIITTKRGINKKANVTYSSSMTLQNMSNAYKMLDAKQFMEQRNRYSYEVWLKSNGLDIYENYITLSPDHVVKPFVPFYTDDQIESATEETDWFKEVTRTGFQHQHNISLNGGTESTQYMASINYFDQDGVVKNNSTSRFTGKFNLDQQVSKLVRIGFSLSFSQNKYDNVPLGSGENENSGIIASAVRFSPLLPIYDENGDYFINPDRAFVPNPVSLLEITDQTKKERLLGSLYAQIEPIKGLVIKGVLGMDRQNQKRENYLPKTTLYGAAVNGQANISQAESNGYLLDLTTTYIKKLGDHSFTALAGYSFQRFDREGFNAINRDFLTDAFLYNNLAAGQYTKPTVGSYGGKNALASYFARINYSFKDRYLLTGTIRADGASNFAKGNRWGYFPSLSLGWRFNNEAFMNSFSSFLSNGKLRLSYGQTGNSNIGTKTMDYYLPGRGNVFGEKGYLGVYAFQLGNPYLTWETTSEYNVGLDLGFFNNRISAVIEYFDRTISDLLSSKSLPSYNEIDIIAANIGKTQSQGVEFTLNTVNITNRNFTWTTDLTLATYKDRWKERDPKWSPASYESVDDPIRPIFKYVSDGLLQAGEVAPVHQKSLLPGQIKLKDLNDDGKLDNSDIVRLGTTDPKFNFGFSNIFRYKKFDLNLYFYGKINQWKAKTYYDGTNTDGQGLLGSQNVSRGFINSWFHDNQKTTRPSPIASDFADGDYFFKKIFFVRVRNFTVGYTIPVSKKIAQRLRIYADINNPFVITNWDGGLDPETDDGYYAYPNVKSYSFGVDITF